MPRSPVEVVPQRGDDLDPGQQVVVDPDPQRLDLLDQAVRRGRLDVGGEDHRAGRRFVGLARHTPDPFEVAEQLTEVGVALGVDG